MAKRQFKAESKRLLDLMINSIYTHKEIFLREIISNASDAIDKLCYLSLTDDKVGISRDEFAIKLVLDKEKRLLTVSDTLDVVISDTVGFIRKLPHQLVEAFKATLEELEYADLLLHVIDASNPEWQEQARIVDDLIRELGAENIPCIRVYNKSDLAFAFQRDKEGDAVSVSAKTGEGLIRLLSAIDKKLDKGTKRVTLHLPYDKAGALDSLYREAKVESVEYGETVDVVAVCTPRIIGQLKDYIEGWTEPKEEWE